MCTFKQPAASTLATHQIVCSELTSPFSSLSPFLSLLFSPNSSVVIRKRGFSVAALKSSEDGLASSETHGTEGYIINEHGKEVFQFRLGTTLS